MTEASGSGQERTTTDSRAAAGDATALTQAQGDASRATIPSRAPKPAGPDQDPVPEIPGYQVQRKLGAGGMGTVYGAIHITLQRPVALKVMRRELIADPDFEERFLREARLAGVINHPNVVTIHDAGRAGGHLFMAFSLVDGSDLGRRIRSGMPLPEAEAIRLIRASALGLSAIHRAGLIHRDIKPENILVGQDGEPQIADLGLARSTTGDDRLTVTGLALGTPAYMSPEQANGIADIDARSDCYSLGATLYALVTAQPPFRGDTPWVTVHKVISEPPPDPRLLNPALSAGLAAVVMRSMAKDRTQRFPDMEALIRALDQIRASDNDAAGRATAQTISLGSRPDGDGAHTTSAVAPRRGRGRLILAGLIGALVVGGALAFLHRRSPVTTVPDPPALVTPVSLADPPVPKAGPLPRPTQPAHGVGTAVVMDAPPGATHVSPASPASPVHPTGGTAAAVRPDPVQLPAHAPAVAVAVATPVPATTSIKPPVAPKATPPPVLVKAPTPPPSLPAPPPVAPSAGPLVPAHAPPVARPPVTTATRPPAPVVSPPPAPREPSPASPQAPRVAVATTMVARPAATSAQAGPQAPGPATPPGPTAAQPANHPRTVATPADGTTPDDTDVPDKPEFIETGSQDIAAGSGFGRVASTFRKLKTDVRGTDHVMISAPPDAVHRVLLDALGAHSMVVTSDEADGDVVTLQTRFLDKTAVILILQPGPGNSTRLAIQVGTFGNRKRSQEIVTMLKASWR